MRLSAASHRLECTNKTFKSERIGVYELSLMEFHNIRLVFNETSQIFVEEHTLKGTEQFLVTKLFNTVNNIRLRRVYKDAGRNQLIIDMKIKPSINVGFVMGQTLIASMLFGHNEVRANRYYHIDDTGVVSFSLLSTQRQDERVNHDIILILNTSESTILGSIDWNRRWKAAFAMKANLITFAQYIDN